MARKKSMFNYINIDKNLEDGGAWLLSFTQKDAEGSIFVAHKSAWKSLPKAKKKAVLLSAKRPKWEVTEDNNTVTGYSEIRVDV
jgi:hypothetical protein